MPEIVHDSAAGTLVWRDEGFWHWQNARHHELSGEEVDVLFNAMEAHVGTRLAPLLIDRTNEYSPHFSAWQRFAERGPSHVSSVAMFAPTAHAAMAASRFAIFFSHNGPGRCRSSGGWKTRSPG